MLDDLKKLLGIEDDSLDQKLELILRSVQGRLKLLLRGIEVPEEMNHIVVEVAVIRFNRLGSEGMSSHTMLRAKACLTTTMILMDLWMKYRLFLTHKKNQNEEG